MSLTVLKYVPLLMIVLCNNALAPMSNNYKAIQCTLKPRASRAHTFLHPHLPGPNPTSKTRAASEDTSTNWGGFVGVSNLHNPKKNSVNYVAGSWVVPTVTGTTNAYAAYWVGIDGFTSPTVEQIGTAHDMVDGQQQHYAWFEMYPRSSYEIVGFPVEPGNVISASVTYTGKGVFRLNIINHTRSVTFAVPISYTKLVSAKRSSAEWIVEAPFLNGVLPLSNFGTAYLWGCKATINGITAQIGNNSWDKWSLQMVTEREVVKANPSSLLPDAGSFFMEWAHS